MVVEQVYFSSYILFMYCSNNIPIFVLYRVPIRNRRTCTEVVVIYYNNNNNNSAISMGSYCDNNNYNAAYHNHIHNILYMFIHIYIYI